MSATAATTVDHVRYRDAISHHAAGVAVVTATDGHEPVGMTVSTFASHSIAPPTVSCDLATESRTLAVIRATGRFAVQLLAEDQAGLALQFSRRATDRFAGTRWWSWQGLPALPGALARFACDLHAEVEVGDHAVVLGLVADAVADPDRRPLIHHHRGFHALR